VLVGPAQEFTDAELEDPILRGIDKDDSVGRNPCLRRGPLSLDYWTRLPIQFWRFLRVDVLKEIGADLALLEGADEDAVRPAC
jgi:hypothetical protein